VRHLQTHNYDAVEEVLQRAYRDAHPGHLDVDGVRSQLAVGRDAVEPLDHVQISELRGDQCSFAAAKLGGDGTLGAEQRLPQLDVAAKLGDQLGEPVEVVGRRVGHDVAVLRSAYDTPGSERQTADDDEADIRLNEAARAASHASVADVPAVDDGVVAAGQLADNLVIGSSPIAWIFEELIERLAGARGVCGLETLVVPRCSGCGLVDVDGGVALAAAGLGLDA